MRNAARYVAAFGLTLAFAPVLPAQILARSNGTTGISVWKDKDFKGESATLREDIPDLSRLRLGSSISSFRVAPGEYWEGCDQVNYRGRCQVFSGSDANLDGSNWNDRIMSIRRVTGNESRRGDVGRRGDRGVGRNDAGRRDDRGDRNGDRYGTRDRREPVFDDAARACTDEAQRRGLTVASTDTPRHDGMIVSMDMQVRRNSRGRATAARCTYDPRNSTARVSY